MRLHKQQKQATTETKATEREVKRMWVTKKDIKELGGRYAEKCKTIDEYFSDGLRKERENLPMEERMHAVEYDVCVDSRMTFINSYWIRRTSTVAWLSLFLNVVLSVILWLK